MTMTVEQYSAEVAQKETRIDDLINTISQNESKLPNLEQQYRDSVANDGNDVDDLFHEIDSLKAKIKADKHKLSTLEGVTGEHLKNIAIKVLEGFHDSVEVIYQDKANQLSEEIKKAKNDYLKKVRKFNEESIKINDDYNDEIKAYGQIMKDNAIDKGEVNKIQSGLGSILDNSLYGERRYVFIESRTITDQEINNIKKVVK